MWCLQDCLRVLQHSNARVIGSVTFCGSTSTNLHQNARRRCSPSFAATCQSKNAIIARCFQASIIQSCTQNLASIGGILVQQCRATGRHYTTRGDFTVTLRSVTPLMTLLDQDREKLTTPINGGVSTSFSRLPLTVISPTSSAGQLKAPSTTVFGLCEWNWRHVVKDGRALVVSDCWSERKFCVISHVKCVLLSSYVIRLKHVSRMWVVACVQILFSVHLSTGT